MRVEAPDNADEDAVEAAPDLAGEIALMAERARRLEIATEMRAGSTRRTGHVLAGPSSKILTDLEVETWCRARVCGWRR